MPLDDTDLNAKNFGLHSQGNITLIKASIMSHYTNILYTFFFSQDFTPYSAILESITYVNNICNVSGYTVYVQIQLFTEV